MSWLDIPAGQPGPPGPPGEQSPLTVHAASPNLSIGKAVAMINGQIALANPTYLTPTLMPAGIVIQAGVAGDKLQTVTQGLVDPALKTLGAGVACAVGTDANGNPVRVTDAACVSGLKYLGVCDINGAIYVSPKSTNHPSVIDYAADPTGATDSTTAFAKAIAVAKTKVIVPSGVYKHTGITLPPGVILRGETAPCITGSAAFGNASWPTFVSGTVLQNTGSGDSITISGNPSSNFGLEDIVILGSGSGTGHGLKLPTTGAILRARLSNVLIVNCFIGMSLGIAEDVAGYSVHTYGCGTGLLFNGPASNDIRFYDWQAGGCTKAASLIDGGGVDFFGGIVQSNTNGIVVEPNTAGGNNFDRTHVTGFWFENNTNGSIILDNTDGNIQDFVIDNCRSSAANALVFLDTDMSGPFYSVARLVLGHGLQFKSQALTIPAQCNFTKIFGATFSSITNNGNFTEIFGVGADCLINGNLIATDGIRSRTGTLGIQAAGLAHDQIQAKTDGTVAVRDPSANVDLMFSFGSLAQRQWFVNTPLQLLVSTAAGGASQGLSNQHFQTATGTFNLGDPAVFAGQVFELIKQFAGGSVTFHRHGSEKINGATSDLTVTTDWTVFKVRSDGVDWVIS